MSYQYYSGIPNHLDPIRRFIKAWGWALVILAACGAFYIWAIGQVLGTLSTIDPSKFSDGEKIIILLLVLVLWSIPSKTDCSCKGK